MDFSYKLNIHLSTLITGVTFNLSQMEKLISFMPQSDQSLHQNVLIRMLAIAHSIFTAPQKTSQLEALGLLLKGLVPKAQFSKPLSLLASCDFNKYHEYCMYSQNEELKKVSRHTFGLYPLTYSGLQLPVSIFIQKGTGAIHGNPHWLAARKTLGEYYQIKGSKSIEKVKQIYLFLLSDKRLLNLWKKDFFKLFWTKLYFRYNTYALDPYLQDNSNGQVSWQRRTQKQTIQSLKTLQQSLPLDQRLLYYLTLAILSNYQQYNCNMNYNPFQAAFSSFLKTEKDYAPFYYLMALLLFHLIAQCRNITQISEQSINKFKIMANNPKYLKDATPFIYFFLNQQEILQFAALNQIQYWKIPMTNELKKKIANYQTINGVFFVQSLKIIQKQLLVPHVLQSPFLHDPRIGPAQLIRLQKQQQIIALNIAQIVKIPYLQMLRDYRIFIQAWKNYHQLLKANSLELADYALTDNSSFHNNNKNVFILPKDNSQAAFNVAIRVARAYRAKADYLNQLPALRSKMEYFQNQIFPKLSMILSEEQCNQFWKEWIQILKHDSAFIGEIMKTAQ